MNRKQIGTILIGLWGLYIAFRAYQANLLVTLAVAFVSLGLIAAAPGGIVDRLDNRLKNTEDDSD